MKPARVAQRTVLKVYIYSQLQRRLMYK